MKIAIYHNLFIGGAYVQLQKFAEILGKNNIVDIYTPTRYEPIKNTRRTFYTRQIFFKNIIDFLFKTLFIQNMIEKRIATIIHKRNYDFVFVFPCKFTQSPHILRHLKNHPKLIYMFQEPPREFYEKTSFDYFSLRQKLNRTLRFPLKIIDYYNCRYAKNIIVNSKYSRSVLNKFYRKSGTVIYPGMKRTHDYAKLIINNKKVITVGLLSYLKGYEFTFKQLSGIVKEITIIGRKSHDSNQIFKIAKEYNLKINLIETEDNDIKTKLLKKHSIFLANQINEPFGLTTLEATNANCYVLGLRNGGTSEIIDTKKSGVLYENDLKTSRSILKKILKRDKISIIKNCRIDWNYMTRSIIEYCKSISINE
jgi:glycosyltransferase involved in cell wall biosynthesis